MNKLYTTFSTLIIFCVITVSGYSQTSSSLTWQQVGAGLSSQVFTVAIKNENEIYAGGQFVYSDGVLMNKVAMWNGSEWLPMNGGVNNAVRDIVIKGEDVYVAGEFTLAGGVTVNRIAKWDGTNWSPLGAGFNSRVSKIRFHGDDLYAIGFFSMSGTDSVRQIAKWNGTTWSPLGEGINLNLNALAIADDGTVYAGGLFTLAGGQPARSIAKWDGNSWSEVGGGIRGMIEDMYCIGNDLYITGMLDSAGTIAVKNVVKWDGNSWTAIGNTLAGAPRNIYAVSSEEVYVGGYYSPYGSLFGVWNGTEWTYPAPHLNSSIFSIRKFNDMIVVGGQFNFFGSNELKNIAMLTKISTGVGNSGEIANNFKLYQNFPNPFNPVTKIKFDLPKQSSAKLSVYDINGRFISTLIEGSLDAGSHEVDFNPANLSSGIYFYKLEADGFSKTNRMILLK